MVSGYAVHGAVGGYPQRTFDTLHSAEVHLDGFALGLTSRMTVSPLKLRILHYYMRKEYE